jgi:hypothetical protein
MGCGPRYRLEKGRGLLSLLLVVVLQKNYVASRGTGGCSDIVAIEMAVNSKRTRSMSMLGLVGKE